MEEQDPSPRNRLAEALSDVCSDWLIDAACDLMPSTDFGELASQTDRSLAASVLEHGQYAQQVNEVSDRHDCFIVTQVPCCFASKSRML